MITLKQLKKFIEVDNKIDVTQEGTYVGFGIYKGIVSPVVLEDDYNLAKKQMINGLFSDYTFCYVGFDGFDVHSIESLHDEFETWYYDE